MSEGIYVQVFQWVFFSGIMHITSIQMSIALFMVSYCTKFKVGAASYKRCLCFNFTCEFVSRACSVHIAFHNIFTHYTTTNADLLAFLFSVDKSIGSGCFFPGLDPSVNLICHAAITEMIKLQLLPIGYEIKSGMGTGSWNLA